MYTPPRRPPWYANTQITIPICLIVVVATVFAVAMVIIGSDRARTGTLQTDPAVVFDDAPAVELRYTYTSADGTSSTGQFTVTADGYATGTVSDQFAGAATVHTTPDETAVWADRDWWAARAPAQADQVSDQWVRPEPGTVLPVDLAAAFNPEALADLVRAINESGTVTETAPHQGTPAVAVTWQDWTLIRTTVLPARVISLAGPVDTDLFHPAAASETTVEAVPGIWDGTDPGIRQVQDGSGLGSIGIAPAPATPEAATTTENQSKKTLSGQGTDPAADPETTSPPAAEEPPPAQADFTVIAPEFTGTINATNCSTPTCSWSATIQNVGNGPGEAIVTSSATPGMGAVTENLGTIQPGEQKSTSTMSFANPAPKPAPGQTSSVTVNYSVVVYAPQIGGSSEPRYRDLIDRLGGYQVQPLLDQLLRSLDGSGQDTAIEAMHDMLDESVPAEEVLSALDQAAEADPASGEYADTPQLRRLVDAGDRFTSWGEVAQQLNSLDSAMLPSYMAGVETALEALADPAAPTVSLHSYPLDGQSGLDTVVISDYGSPETTECTHVTTSTGGGLANAVDAGVERLNDPANPAADVLDQCAATVRVDLQDGTSPLWNADDQSVQNQMADEASDLEFCGNTGMRADSIQVTNAAGATEWNASALCLYPAYAYTPHYNRDTLGRVTSMTVLLEKGSFTKVGSDTWDMAMWGFNDIPPGKVKGDAMNRSHILGAQLGGTNHEDLQAIDVAVLELGGTLPHDRWKDYENLVTLHRNANSPEMSTIENAVADGVNNYGRVVKYKVELEYDANSLIPSHVVISAETADDGPPVSISERIPNVADPGAEGYVRLDSSQIDWS